MSVGFAGDVSDALRGYRLESPVRRWIVARRVGVEYFVGFFLVSRCVPAHGTSNIPLSSLERLYVLYFYARCSRLAL